MLKYIGSYLFKSAQTYPLRESVRYKRRVAEVVSKRRRTLNPGVQLQSGLIKEKPEDEIDISDIDELESMESDFMSVGTSHKEHLGEIYRLKEKEKFLIVKQKYFKQNFPNFLSWSDKEQIRYLYKTNPNEWTIEKLSEGFPALPETIKKIIKAAWTKKNSSKIINHDNSVKRNWMLFKNGQLTLPPGLTNHLHKFTNRANYGFQTTIPTDKEIVKTSTPKVNGEFSEIIKSYERIKNKDKRIEDEQAQQPEVFDIKKRKKETYLISNVDYTNYTTLECLKTSLEADVSLGKDIDEDDKILLKQLNDTSIVEKISEENPIIDLKDISKTAYLSVNSKSPRDDSHLKYPEKIIIPKDKLKRGYTYKLNDCYYDSDGLFLYRVPGME